MNNIFYLLASLVLVLIFFVAFLLIRVTILKESLDAALFKSVKDDAKIAGSEARKAAENENANSHMLRLRTLFGFKPKS